MQLYKLLSCFLDYPTLALNEYRDEAEQIIYNHPTLSAASRQGLMQFIDAKAQLELLDWQSDYDALFERGRNLSLLLFEHVHGESRDRGQAMVDLMAQYRQAGLEIGVQELPDYLPLFLEFLSTQTPENAQAWLADMSHILATLQTRLEQREPAYAALFSCLLDLSACDIDLAPLRQQSAKEERDDSMAAIDKIWEEEAVTFSNQDGSQQTAGCGQSLNRPSSQQNRHDEMPVHIIQPAGASASAQPR